jgi:sporulation protein YlmC with PRC-barrel domain
VVRSGTAAVVACFVLTDFSCLGEKKMLMKSFAAGLAASALLVTVASAETSMNKTANVATTSEQSVQGDWRTSKIIGLNVYNDNNDNIGTISDLLTDKNGNIKAAVLGVGGFLGVGEHLVAVPFDKIKFVNAPVSSTSSNTSNTRPASSTTTGNANSDSSKSTSSKSDRWYPDHAVFNATKDELKAMPEFKYST